MIQIRQLHKSFGQQHVLRGIDLEIPTGAIFVVVGSSGTGKSCLLKHIIGLMRPDSGEVWIDNIHISALRGRALNRVRDRFSMLFQGGAMFDSLSVYDNLAFPLREKTRLREKSIRNKVRERLDQVGLSDVETKLPSELSGGMLKRAALARALVTDPEILLFDEPTTGLDPIRVNTIHQLILDLHGLLNFTAVVVSHEIPEVFSLATHIAMLDEGKVAATGTPEELQASADPVVQQFIHGRTEGPIQVQ